MHSFKELKIWIRSIDLATEVYEVTKGFPVEEKYGLISQMRRSAVSISSNIAEGAGRNTNGEFRQFLGIANGSSFELYSQLVIADKLNLIPKDIVSTLLTELAELQKMNYALQESKK